MGLVYAILPAQVYLCGLEITVLNAQHENFVWGLSDLIFLSVLQSGLPAGKGASNAKVFKH